jgi:PKD repeat protein
MSAATFVVTLTLTDDDGLTSSCTQNVTVGNALPLCTFTVNPNSGTAPLDVDFDAGGSTDQDEGGASIVSYNWDFGDGNSEINAAPTDTTSHTYTNTGTFTVTLIVTDDEGGFSECERTVNATGAIPTASFTASPVSGTADNEDDPITFDASASTDNDELGLTIVQYQWDFGDGTAVVTTNNPVTVHTFVNPGNFSVTLTVTDDEGQTDTENQAYIVDADP